MLMATILNRKTPLEIEEELLDPDNAFKSIKNPKQARYFVQQHRKKQRNHLPAASVADEIAIVQRMHQNPSYKEWVKEIIWNPVTQNPIILLYTAGFITDIASSSLGPDPIVLGLDKTYEVST